MDIIDLRSDTVTLPPPGMRESILEAGLGDDVFQEDPTVNRLEQLSAELMGKEAALLVTSGTMGNLVCALTHCQRGDEAILGDQAHMFIYEAGSMAVLGGIHPRTIPNQPDGKINLEQIKAAIRTENVHFPRTKMICLENTHNRCYGSPLEPEYMAQVEEVARQAGLRIHLDGARIFNASKALNVPVKELTKYVDSVMFCLSKGLSAPVGSMVCGTREFIYEARRNRKILGGGMRQAGVIASPGLWALNKMIDRIEQDHQNARKLALGIAQIPGLTINLEMVKTNIVYFDLNDSKINTQELVDRMGKKKIHFFATGPSRFRMVTHYGILENHIDQTLKELEKIMATP